jgi:hypothetical protein
MKPLLTNSQPPLTATLPACLIPITKFLTTKEQRTTIVSFEFKKLIYLLNLGMICIAYDFFSFH